MLEVADITPSSSLNAPPNISRAIVGCEGDMVRHMQWVVLKVFELSGGKCSCVA
jgi:hypothetical protein